MKPILQTLALALAFGVAAANAAEQAIFFDPLTVKTGEELRITLFNPRAEPITMKVFAYNSAENTYDEGPSFVIAPGKMRFFDLKLTKEFVGLAGVLETVPDAPAPVPTASKGSAKPEIMLTDLLVSSVMSRGSLQQRGPSGQTQTLGYSFGATQTGGGWFNAMQSEATRVTSSRWIGSKE